MSIPIILVWGHKTQLRKNGWSAERCPRCETVKPFECFDQLESSHIYFIYGPEKKIAQVLICDFCETAFGLKPGSLEAKGLKVTWDWQRSDGLQALVDLTNPGLGKVTQTPEPTQSELSALLVSVNERSGAYRLKLRWGWLLGAVSGAILLALLANIYYRVTSTGADTGTTNFVYGVIGALIGAVVGIYWDYRNLSRRVALEVLAGAIRRNNLFADDLRRALAKYPKPLKRVEEALKQLDEDSEPASNSDRTPNVPKRKVCQHCKLVNFPQAEVCKRCGRPLTVSE